MNLHGCKVRIRLARDSDLDEIETMDRRFIDNGGASSDTVFHVAELVAPCPLGTGLTAREVIAYGGHRCPPEFPGVAFLSRSGVLPECRGAGLQARLIRARLAYLRREGQCTHAVTYTMVTNAASSNSLIRCGFKLWRPGTGDLWVGPEVNYWRIPL